MPEAAIGLVDPQLLPALALHLVGHADPVVVHRQVEVGERRPDEACRERLAGFHVQFHVAGVDIEGVDVPGSVVVALAVAEARFVLAALVVVGGERAVEVIAGEQVVHVGRAEAGAVGAAHQQRVGRSPFQAHAVGELARILVAIAVAVVAAGQAGLQGRRQWQAKLAGGAPVIAVATAVAVARAVVGVGGQGQGIGIDAVGLGAEFQRAGEADVAGRHREQGGGIDGEAEVVVVGLGAEGGHRADGGELGRRQRGEQARRVRAVDRVAVGVIALPFAQEQPIGGIGPDPRHAHVGVVLGMVVGRFPVPVLCRTRP